MENFNFKGLGEYKDHHLGEEMKEEMKRERKLQTLTELGEEGILEEIKKIKAEMGEELCILGHHYQKDTILGLSDHVGDSLELSKEVANISAKHIVFCGVHFMGETADLLKKSHQKVYLPDCSAGCSLAEYATLDQAKGAQSLFERKGWSMLPLTYVNSSAAIKAFVGQAGGSCLTSGNADAVFAWALKQNKTILFLPDQHLGRNTAKKAALNPDEIGTYDPVHHSYEGPENPKLVLWQGQCDVHQVFRPEMVKKVKDEDPHRLILVHPECRNEVVELSDLAGSTSFIIKTLEKAKPGSKWAIGTESNLVDRLSRRFPDLDIINLSEDKVYCPTMNQIDLKNLRSVLNEIQRGEKDHLIQVEGAYRVAAKASLDTMLAITQ